MGTALLVGGALLSLVSAVGTARAENEAAQASIDSQAAQTALEVEELGRQQDAANEIAQEDKSDAVREADAQFASMIVALADGGGAGSINQARSAVEIGFTEGVNVARIEGNRRREVAAKQSGKRGSVNRLTDTNKAAKIKSRAATTRFLGSVASTGISLGVGLNAGG